MVHFKLIFIFFSALLFYFCIPCIIITILTKLKTINYLRILNIFSKLLKKKNNNFEFLQQIFENKNCSRYFYFTFDFWLTLHFMVIFTLLVLVDNFFLFSAYFAFLVYLFGTCFPESFKIGSVRSKWISYWIRETIL